MEFINKIVKFIKRSRISNLGPAKDWKLYQELFGTNQRRVSHETSLSIPAYFRALSILSEQIASLPFSIYELKKFSRLSPELIPDLARQYIRPSLFPIA